MSGSSCFCCWRSFTLSFWIARSIFWTICFVPAGLKWITGSTAVFGCVFTKSMIPGSIFEGIEVTHRCLIQSSPDRHAPSS